MTFLQILAIAIVAALVGVLFYYVFKTAGPWGRFWSFVLILILAGIAAAAWIPPLGPVYWDVSWVPVLIVILLFALFLAAATPPRGKEKVPPEEHPGPRQYASEVVVLNTFFWVFVVLLFIAALFGIIVSLGD